ncbi:DotU family type IV/VI secretion system protein [Campylobacter jejuni]|nr:DotU family type IV/VI secretion system protein [Campylobacter jejuni]
MKEINEEKKALSLLLDSDFDGLKNNKIIDYSLELLLLSYRLSKISSMDTSSINQLRETLINKILDITAKLSMCKEYDEKEIIKFKYCLCVFIDESLMKNELFINFWAHNTLTVRLFDETLGGNNFYDIASSWNNIATSLKPVYKIEEELAFNKAYKTGLKENIWQKFIRLYFKKLIIVVPVLIILGVLSYAIFNLETNNLKVDNNISVLIKNLTHIE